MKVQILHPITHNNRDYDRGFADMDLELAVLLRNTAPHAIVLCEPVPEPVAPVEKKPDSGKRR